MSNKTRHSLPFDSEDFGFSEFEGFMVSLLSLSEELPIGGDDSVIKSPQIVHRYGKQGDAQRGIDILAEVDGGRRIVVQCKYHDPKAKVGRVTLSEAEKAVQKAEEEYPKADEYILATNSDYNQPEAIEFAMARDKWTFWGKQELHLLVRQLPIAKAWHLIVDHFGESVAWEFFPLGPALYLEPEHYRKLGGGSLSHQYPCVGRDSEIKAIKKGLLSKKAKAVIVPGDGGIGKSRLFLEVLEQVKSENPDIEVLIAEPDSEGKWEQIGLQNEKPIIIGLDDCHLPDRLSKKFLILARQRKNTRLLLVTRPAAVAEVRQKLRQTGWEEWISEPFKQGALPNLKVSAMRQLAREIIGADHTDIPELVNCSNGNALFVVIASEKIRDHGWRIRNLPNVAEFSEAIFGILRDEITEGCDHEKRALHSATILAALSPFKVSDFPEIADLLEVGEYELDEEIHRLRNLGLVRLGSGTGRIIPDLFSDYLVRNAFASNSHDWLRRRLFQSSLFHHKNTSVFKSLAMAQWHQSRENPQAESLVESLWTRFREDLEKEDDTTRRTMLKSWGSFGLFLPKETLALCRFVLQLQPASPDHPYLEVDHYRIIYRDFRRAEVIALLKNLAQYHLNEQGEALDILWDLLIENEESLKEGGKEVFSEILSYQGGRHPDSIHGALKWLDEKLRIPSNLARVTERASHLVQTLLGNLFESSLERTEWEANSMKIWNVPIHIENTEPIRNEAFDLIEKIALTSPLGARNCLNLLVGIFSPSCQLVGGKPVTKAFEEKWLFVRSRALDILEKIGAEIECDIVSYLLRKQMKEVLRYAEESELSKRAQALIAAMSQSRERQRLIVLLSDQYTEFRQRSDKVDQEAGSKESEKWLELADDVANELLNEFPNSEGIASWCEGIGGELVQFDLAPNYYELFTAFSRVSPTMIEELRQYVLENEGCDFEGSYAQFAFWLQQGEELQDQNLSEGVRLGRPRAFGSVLNALQYRQSKFEFPRTKQAVVKLLSEVASDEIDRLFRVLNIVRTEELTHLIYENFPWQKLGKEHFSWLGNRYDIYRGAHLFKDFPLSAFEPMFDRLRELPSEVMQEVRDLVVYACREVPEAAFEFFDQRVKQAKEGDESIFLITLERVCFGDLSEVPNLEERVEEVYQKSEESADGTGLWNDWLTMILRRQGSLEEQLLKRRISRQEGGANIVNFVEYQMEAHQVFSFPSAVELILNKAESLGRQQRREITDQLFYRITNHGQSYDNGEPQNTWHLDQARQLSEKFRDNELLYPFYDRIVKYEQADGERNRRDYERRIERGDEFE